MHLDLLFFFLKSAAAMWKLTRASTQFLECQKFYSCIAVPTEYCFSNINLSGYGSYG